jgi:hypothetical protein
MMKLFGLVPMNEAAADGGDGGGGDAPAADPAPAAAPAPAATDAPAAAGSLLGDLAKPEGEAAASDDVAKTEADAPGAPEAYEFKMPEGVELDENALPMVQDLFKELGLPQDKAQDVLTKLLEIDQARQPSPEQIQQQYEEQAADLNKTWGEECRKLEGLGGENFNKSLETCSQVMVKFASPELRNFLTYSALGSNPEFFKFVHAIGSAMSQDTMEHGGAVSKGQRSIEQRLWPEQK